MERKFYFMEADDDNTPDPGYGNGGNAPVTDNGENTTGTDDANTDNNTDTNNNDNTDQNNNNDQNNNDQNNNQDNNNQQQDDSDYTINTDDDSTNDDNTGDDTATPDTNTDDTQTDTDNQEDTSMQTDIKSSEKELFDSLSPEEQKAKNEMLKKLYVDLYAKCGSLIDKINNISADVDVANLQLKRLINMIFDLRTMINDYFNNIYDSKSYIENDIMFNRYLSILTSSESILKIVDKANVEYIDKEEKKKSAAELADK